MRRHWQHTSFCMGQCVSSCGSKRTLDSVPTTPDTENYPGLIPTAKIIHRKNSSSNFTAIEDQDALAFQQKPKSPAAKFVTAFSQRRIVTRRINPEGESPVHISKNSPRRGLPFSIATLQTSDSIIYHHGDMKDSTVKNYFRETISSAKKTSSKSVTFSEESPAATVSRKKSFFSFHKSKSNKSKTQEGAEPETESSPSLALSKAILRKRSKNSGAHTLPTIVRPLKEKQVCRVTLSPKHGTTVVDVELKENHNLVRGSNDLKSNTNGDEEVHSNYFGKATTTSNQAMGNASSSSQGLVVEAVKTIKPIVKSNSTSKSKCPNIPNVDVNENNTKSPCTVLIKKLSGSPGLTRKESKKRLPVSQNKNESGNILRNINSIKEENRLLRLKFFLEEESSENITSPLKIMSSGGDSSLETVFKMSRQNFYHNKSAIPLPKSAPGKTGNNSSSNIPKLYSVVINENETTQKSAGGTNLRSTTNQKVDSSQPTNLTSGKWVPAADFFEQPSDTSSDKSQPAQSHTSPSTSKSVRRSSEPPRWLPQSSSLPSKVMRDVKCPDLITERRGTIGYQPRKLTGGPHSINVSKIIKPTLISTSDKNTGAVKSLPIKVGIRKPEETKPFYTIGLYQNRPKTSENPKTFGVHQSGFHGVSTGIVRQRTQQYQSKAADNSHVPKLHSNLRESVLDRKREEKGNMLESVSPKKPGVIRSATYTIRRHALSDDSGPVDKSNVKAKSDVDPRYLTWTVRKPGKLGMVKGNSFTENTHRHARQNERAQNEQAYSMDERISTNMLSPMGYPLQHNASGASTSSMGTNEDGIGDHVVISDSEYLIDDEISDQPDLTLTFKDSSLKLSPSSSGESLLSDIMLDHLDLNQERILGELTSDSAISDISSHKPVTKGSCDHILKLTEGSKSKIFEQPCTNKALEKANSTSETATPSSVRTVKHLRSPRRTSKPTSGSGITKSPGSTIAPAEVNISRSSSTTRSPSSTSNTGIKYRTAPERKPTVAKPSHGKTSSTSLSPLNRTKTSTKEHIAVLTVENVNKLHKQYELTDSQNNVVIDEVNSLSAPLAEELLVEFQDLKDELEKLKLQLETQERRERDKDELILRLTSEVERLKSGKNLDKSKEKNMKVISPGHIESDGTSVEKELYLNSLNYENAAVQTENNNIFNRAVTYPEEDDKYGELVSFRIGRSSSLKKKL